MQPLFLSSYFYFLFLYFCFNFLICVTDIRTCTLLTSPPIDLASKSTKLSEKPSFTFIDHQDDLTSKRITDVNTRKAIRSHVMRDVRRRERLAGQKRPSKKSATNKKKPSTSSASSSRSGDVSSPSPPAVYSPDSHNSSSPNTQYSDPGCPTPEEQQRQQATHFEYKNSASAQGHDPTAAFQSGHCMSITTFNNRLDPFNTLPYSNESPISS